MRCLHSVFESKILVSCIINDDNGVSHQLAFLPVSSATRFPMVNLQEVLVHFHGGYSLKYPIYGKARPARDAFSKLQTSLLVKLYVLARRSIVH